MQQSENKCVAFVHGVHAYHVGQAVGFAIDWQKFKDVLEKQWGQVFGLYYCSIVKPTEEPEPLRKLLDWLEYHGYRLVTTETRTFERADGSTNTVGSVDVALAVKAMRVAQYADEVMLLISSREFVPLVEALKGMGKRVIVLSTLEQGQVADELRRAADEFVDIRSMEALVAQPRR